MLEHGGWLRQAAADSDIPLEQWLDLSTGINPCSWQPREPIPVSCWQRLPEVDDGLEQAARDYYGCASLLPVAGSQMAIQALPQLKRLGTVAMARLAYAEHAHHWLNHNHNVVLIDEDYFEESINQLLPQLDVLLLINPTNPSGRRFTVEQLLAWHQQLATRGGWLLVDEAFIDITPDQSLAAYCDRPGLIILRSVGKFFGLAGARVGFVLAQRPLLDALNELLGPWTLSGPSRWLVQQALRDQQWQEAMRLHLVAGSERLAVLLKHCGLRPTGGSALFQYCSHPAAAELYQALQAQGVLVRLFDEPAALRFGLPADEVGWEQLEHALKQLKLPALSSYCD